MTPLWSDDDLRCLERDYDSDHGGHDDVVSLIRGARAVLALHRPAPEGNRIVLYCDHCDDLNHGAGPSWPCPTVRALSLEESP